MPKTSPDHRSWLQCYLDTGMPGLLATLVFIGVLAFAVVILRKRLGLRHRLALLPLSLIPLISGMMGCAYDYMVPWYRAEPDLAQSSYRTIREAPLQIIAMTSAQTGILLLVCIALLAHKDAVRQF